MILAGYCIYLYIDTADTSQNWSQNPAFSSQSFACFRQEFCKLAPKGAHTVLKL